MRLRELLSSAQNWITGVTQLQAKILRERIQVLFVPCDHFLLTDLSRPVRQVARCDIRSHTRELFNRAGDGNRTHFRSLEAYCPTNGPDPHKLWSARPESNQPPHPYQGCALPGELRAETWYPRMDLNHRLPLCKRGTLCQTELLGRAWYA